MYARNQYAIEDFILVMCIVRPSEMDESAWDGTRDL